MGMTWLDYLGFAAGVLTTMAAVPQLVKTWRRKEAGDISKRWCVVLLGGVFLWTVYGIFKNDIAIIVANSVSVVLNAFLLFLLFKYGGQK